MQPSMQGDDTPLWRKALPIVIILVVLGGAGYGVSTLMGSGGTGAKKQVVKIAVLPDTPPPPPPPEKKPEPPKEEPKQVMQTEQAKVAEKPPQEAPSLKMEGQAGDGPSAFTSGSVKDDYKGQSIGQGEGTAAPKSTDRAKFNYYAKSALQLLRAELDKTLPPDMYRLGAILQIWVDGGGAISRFQLQGLSDKSAEDKLRKAMEAAVHEYRNVPPAGMPQPIELRLSVNPAGG